MHICDDYYLQGWLASAKQKKWWEKNAPDEMYKRDYLAALAMHSMSWSTMILAPLLVTYGMGSSLFISIAWVVNAVLHGLVDNLKANKQKINLIVDQSAHIVQIILTAVVCQLLMK